MTAAIREHLPNRRKNFTQKSRVGGQTVYVTFGEYEDGRLAEIFVDLSKAGSALRALMNTVAVFLSIGIQHGVPLNLYIEAIRGKQFLPCGTVTGSQNVEHACSILDWLAQELQQSYPDGKAGGLAEATPNQELPKS